MEKICIMMLRFSFTKKHLVLNKIFVSRKEMKNFLLIPMIELCLQMHYKMMIQRFDNELLLSAIGLVLNLGCAVHRITAKPTERACFRVLGNYNIVYPTSPKFDLGTRLMRPSRISPSRHIR